MLQSVILIKQNVVIDDYVLKWINKPIRKGHAS